MEGRLSRYRKKGNGGKAKTQKRKKILGTLSSVRYREVPPCREEMNPQRNRIRKEEEGRAHFLKIPGKNRSKHSTKPNGKEQENASKIEPPNGRAKRSPKGTLPCRALGRELNSTLPLVKKKKKKK